MANFKAAKNQLGVQDAELVLQYVRSIAALACTAGSKPFCRKTPDPSHAPHHSARGVLFALLGGRKSDRVAGVEALADVLVAVYGAAGAGVCAVHPLPADRDMASQPHDRLISELPTGVRRRPSVFGAAVPRFFVCAAAAAGKKNSPAGHTREGGKDPVVGQFSSRQARRSAFALAVRSLRTGSRAAAAPKSTAGSTHAKPRSNSGSLCRNVSGTP